MQNINTITTSMGIATEYHQNDSLSLQIEAPEDIIDYVRTQFIDSSLVIDFSKQLNLRNTKVHIKVTAPTVTNFLASSGSNIYIPKGINSHNRDIIINTSSGAEVEIKGNNNAENISLLSSSGSEITIDSLSAESLNAAASSGSDINIAGTCNSVNLTASSGSEISAAKFYARSGTAAASSGAEISCKIEKPTTINKSSGGSVKNK